MDSNIVSIDLQQLDADQNSNTKSSRLTSRHPSLSLLNRCEFCYPLPLGSNTALLGIRFQRKCVNAKKINNSSNEVTEWLCPLTIDHSLSLSLKLSLPRQRRTYMPKLAI